MSLCRCGCGVETPPRQPGRGGTPLYATDECRRKRHNERVRRQKSERYHSDEEYRERRRIEARDRLRLKVFGDALYLRDDPCSYCGGPAGTGDHIVPQAQDGDDGWENLTAACRACNAAKGDRSLLGHLLTTRIDAVLLPLLRQRELITGSAAEHHSLSLTRRHLGDLS